VYGDFSRVLDGLSGQYSAVLAQQGRLLLDAELNEQTAILLGYMRQLATDLIGPFAGPVHHCGFGVEPVVADGKCHAVRLSRGHYYVFGLRCSAPAPNRAADEAIAIGEHEPPFVVHLIVWEQSVGAIQAPGLLDPALGPGIPDTSRRSQVRWRPAAARHLPGSEDDLTPLEPAEIIRAFHEYDADPRRRPTLGARAHSGSDSEAGPSTAPVARGYRGVENQLYRVEVHRGGDEEAATFKWSRDNGSVEFGLDALSEAADGLRTVTLQRIWTDARQGLEVGDWVELVDDDWAPLGTPAPLMQVQGVSLATRQVTLQDADASRSFDRQLHPLLRRWDQQPDSQAPGHGISLKQADRSWFELEDGVQVQFEASGAIYERGDFWLIPARTATAGVLWPESSDPDHPGPHALPPHGPMRYLTPLALVSKLDEVTDLRVRFGHRAPEHDDLEETRSQKLAPAVLETPEPAVIRVPAVSYRVRSISSHEAGAVYPVDDGTTVGRAPESGIHLDHPDLSRHHAIFGLEEDVLTIMDLGSTNGTEINGQPLPERVPTEVSPGDTIQLGSGELQLQVEEA
jgi:hypothetical protein